ncbi:hypothetical protein niasHS_016337 [Heterodera schachtii]|uniref:Uncharacterized protein n=1 Tax=Heterodera schachtii TaxID=97005 RepID=A0ABD2HUY1_HETSC
MSNPSLTKNAATQTVDSDEIVPEMPDERALHLQIIEDAYRSAQRNHCLTFVILLRKENKAEIVGRV